MPRSKQLERSKSEPVFEVGSGNVFIDLGFPEDEAVNMLARAELMGEIRNIIRKKGWTQTHAAKVLAMKQPRVAEIMTMKTQHYSVDLLMKLLNKLDKRVLIKIADKNEVA